MSLIAEGAAFLKGRTDSQNTNLPQNDDIEHDFNENEDTLDSPDHTLIQHPNQHDTH